MELRHIRAFLMIAEERSFTRAAARLGIAQPPLSAQVKQLEDHVGTPLFRRLPHGAELTASGGAFFGVVRELPHLAERGLNAARRVARGQAGALTLGFTASSLYHPRLTRPLAAFRTAYPDVELKLEEANTSRLLQGLREDSIDAAFLRPADEDRDGLAVTMLDEEPMIAVLPRSHPSAQDEAIVLSELANTPLLLFPREIGPLLFDVVVNACRLAGFEPKLGQTTPQIASIVHLVAAGFGVAIVPKSLNQLGPEGVVFRPFLGEAPRAPLAFARSLSEPSPVALNFENILREAETQRAF